MKKLFTSDRFFLFSVILSVVSTAIYIGDGLIMWSDYLISAIISAMNTICVIALYISYKKHSKNVMKGLMGCLLMGLVTHAVAITIPFDPATPVYNVLAIINLLSLLALLVNHFYINSDHHSSPAAVRFNQALVIVDFIVFISAGVACLGGTDLVSIIHMIGMVLLVFSNMSVVVCIESRLDAYRLDREKSGWTEETGYPEGYIHQCEKK